MRSALVIDDDPTIAQLVAAVLPGGWSVKGAPHGLAGLDLLARQRQPQAAFDLVVLDIHMPVLDGYDTLLRLRQMLPDTPLIVLTGLSCEEDPDLQAFAAELGCSVVRKQCGPAAIGQALAQAATHAGPIQWSAALGRLQRLARAAEQQARRQRAVRTVLVAHDPLLLAGLKTQLDVERVLVVGEATTPDQLRLLLAGQRVAVLVVAWSAVPWAVASATLYQVPMVIVVPQQCAAHLVWELPGVAGTVSADDPLLASALADAVACAAGGRRYAAVPVPDTQSTPASIAGSCESSVLAPRERALLALDQPGVPLSVLAQLLGVTPRTIQQYRWRIRRKLEHCAARAPS